MTITSARIALDLGDDVRVSPPDWPNSQLSVKPGDLSMIAPSGEGIYGYEDKEERNFLLSAPRFEACGGSFYFVNGVSKADFEALMRVLRIEQRFGKSEKPSKDHAVFVYESAEPGEDGYLAQLRIVSRFGLQFMFGALAEGEYEKFPEQKLTMTETFWLFMEHERNRWGTEFWHDGRGLRGLFGGDGDFAREELSFGFMVENDYHQIYRIWSRAWLVTK